MNQQITIRTHIRAGACDTTLREMIVQTFQDSLDMNFKENIGNIAYFANKQGCHDITIGEIFS